MLAIHTATKTMSSREIAELVDSRHDDVKRSIDRLAQTGESGGHAYHQTRFTPAGIAWIAKRLSVAAQPTLEA